MLWRGHAPHQHSRQRSIRYAAALLHSIYSCGAHRRLPHAHRRQLLAGCGVVLCHFSHLARHERAGNLVHDRGACGHTATCATTECTNNGPCCATCTQQWASTRACISGHAPCAVHAAQHSHTRRAARETAGWRQQRPGKWGEGQRGFSKSHSFGWGTDATAAQQRQREPKQALTSQG